MIPNERNPQSPVESLADQRPIFEADGVTSETRLEVPYGPWLLWGQPLLSFININPQPTKNEDVHYQGWVKLARTPFGTFLPLDVSNVEAFTNGETAILLPQGYSFALGFNDGDPAVVLKTDRNGHVSHLFFEQINAPSIEAALNGIEGLANTVVWMLTVTTNQPVFYDGILVKSTDGAQSRARTRGRAPDVGLNPLEQVYLQSSLRPFVSQYVEGVRSSSPFYSFLCFFKICDRINAVRPRLRKICEKHGVTPPVLNGVLPEDPVAYVSQDMVGIKYTVAVSRYQELYRNGIAHFNPGDRLEPLDVRAEAAVRTAGIVLRWAAFDLIGQIAATMRELEGAGMKLIEIEFG